MSNTAPYGVVCLAGISTVLENDVVVGSVNANLRHYRQAADALAKPTGPGWRA